ncbi:hypothetical protein VOLCADRAFT_92911 [Volvox carteri f. nagariensis]|uniref:Plastid lipid-associated protein/fibrillin conserved domain-containing protein n=1 Tax=Volvox carteri f. nagariensis TaxID=3068 RepID=D8U0S8_VOLCA|nr:uncharacterized protein VOLCADRAFT_92911 [Volvox carteri f. nagariensis]EFJ46767.1 hypothetical protein VOLCADRAFT_92911 [Volvox carteri f. nagariensis]|eukprot:XP_002952296.1 hypothetical protein VOLCADRAFT_92911 [Volvox carteri f. nagariensis]
MPTPSSPQSSKLNDDDSARAQAKARLRQLVSNYVPVLAGAAVGARGAAASGPVFDTRAGKVENQARRFTSSRLRFEVGGMQFCVNVNGTAEVVKGPPGRPCQRLRAVFTSFDVVVDGQKRLSLPLSLLNPVGFVDTPYLDDEPPHPGSTQPPTHPLPAALRVSLVTSSIAAAASLCYVWWPGDIMAPDSLLCEEQIRISVGDKGSLFIAALEAR